MIKNIALLSCFMVLTLFAAAQQRATAPKQSAPSRQSNVTPERSTSPTPKAAPLNATAPAAHSTPVPPAQVPLRSVVEQGANATGLPEKTAQPARPVRKKVGMVAKPMTTEPKISK